MAKSNPDMNELHSAVERPAAQRDALKDLFKRVASGVETIALAAPTGLPAAAAGSGVTGGPDLARIADDSISRLLGGAAGGKPDQFLARLKAVFPAEVKDRKTSYTYRATGSQPLDGPSMALVAGAQAAFYAQARALSGSINALLDQLVPVVTDPDQEEIDSLIASFKELTAGVVEEYGREGGAVVNRIDLARVRLQDTGRELLDKLGLGEAADPNDAREMQLLQRNLIDENMAMLGRLRQELTKDLLDDYKNKVVNGISAIIPQLSWTFRAIPATLRQVRTQFDAVGIDLTDRMVQEVESKNIKIEQVLQWAEAAATSDFPRRLAAGRRSDFEAIKDEANKVHKIVKRLARQFENAVGGGRLKAALKELRQHFKSVKKNTGKILAKPEVEPAAKPDADGLAPQGEGGRAGRNAKSAKLRWRWETAPAGVVPKEKVTGGGTATGEGAPVADDGAAAGVYEVVEVRVPDIGDFEDVPIIEIAVKGGDKVKPEDPLITLESDRALIEVPSPTAGTVKDLRVSVGDKVSAGSLILTLETGVAGAAPAAPAKTDAGKADTSKSENAKTDAAKGEVDKPEGAHFASIQTEPKQADPEPRKDSGTETSGE